MQHKKLFRTKDLIDVIEQLDSNYFTLIQVKRALKAQHYWTLGNVVEVALNQLVEEGILTEQDGTYSFQNFRKPTWSEITDEVLTERRSLWKKLANL